MKPLLLLLPLLPLVSADCPHVLKGFNSRMYKLPDYTIAQLDEVVDAVCGRRNFTAAFWSPIFYQQVIALMNIGVYTKFERNYTQIKPLYQSLKTQFDSIEDKEAKEYVNDFLSIQRHTTVIDVMPGKFTARMIAAHMLESLSFHFSHPLPLDAQITLSRAFKDGFGWQETAEMRKDRVHVAMKALERIGMFPHNEKMGEMYAKLFLLMKANTTYVSTSFGQLTEWAQKEWNSTDIGHLEVVPAMETLYVQYTTLKDTKAKKVIDWAIASFAVAHFSGETDDECSDRITFKIQNELMREIHRTMGKLENVCSSSDVARCFANLPDASLSAIMTTFPELFEYFFKQADSTRWKINKEKEPTKSSRKTTESTSVCPILLEGVPTKLVGVERFEEAMETACGRRNFTSAFWSAEFREQMLLQIIFHELRKDDAAFAPFKPLLQSLDSELNSMESVEAKGFIDELRDFQHEFIFEGASKSPAQMFKQIQRKTNLIRKHRLSTNAQIAIADTMKKGFGIVDSVESRRCRIGRAMRAIARIGARSGNAALGRIFGHMLVLMKEESKSIETSDFEEQVYSMEKDGLSSEITAMQVLPAIETLYMQYATLKNVEAKRFADWLIGWLAMKNVRNEGVYEDMPNEQYLRRQVRRLHRRKTCPIDDAGDCFRVLSDEAKIALRTSFPELTVMLERPDFDFNEWTQD